MKDILFVCKYNRFRSRAAEAYFNKINRNKRIKAKSAGIFQGSSLDKEQVNSAKKFDIDISGKPRGISIELLKRQDAIIIAADDVPPSLFNNNKKYGKKIIIWKIKDAKTNEESERTRIIKQIIKKVDDLVNRLKKEEK